MFIKQNILEFIDNPMGKGSNAIPSRNLIKNDLNQRMHKMLTEKKKKFVLDIYDDKGDYYFHFLIPSESVDRHNTYDVVLHFSTDGNDDLKNDPDLRRYSVRFFSNSPSFTFTFAYAFNLYGLMVEGLDSKYRKIVLSNPPITRNPGEIISYEKTVYFAAKYLTEDSNRLLRRMIINTKAKPFKKAPFIAKIRNTDQIELEIKREDMRLKRDRDKNNKTSSSTKRGVTTSQSRERSESKMQKRGNITPSSKRGANKPKITARKATRSKIKPR
jgi:uncharacterized protein YwgA